MEDIGALRSLCINKSERLELKNLPPLIALEFARREAGKHRTFGFEFGNRLALARCLERWKPRRHPPHAEDGATPAIYGRRPDQSPYPLS